LELKNFLIGLIKEIKKCVMIQQVILLYNYKNIIYIITQGMYSQALLTTLTPEEQRTTSTAIEDTSGSGKGYANLEARTIAKDAKYIGDSPIGKGRYGEGNSFIINS